MRFLARIAALAVFAGPLWYSCSSTPEEGADASANANAANGNAAAPKGEEEALDDFSFLDEGKGKGGNAASENAASENGANPGNELLANSNINAEGDEDFDDEDLEGGNPEANANLAGNNPTNLNNFGENAGMNTGDLAAEPVGDDPTIPQNDALANFSGGNPTNAFETANGAEALNNSPVEIAQDNGSAAVAPVPVEPIPEAESSIAPVAPVAAAPVKVATDDIEATDSTVHWVGYHIDEKTRKLQVEIVTKGRPEFQIYQEQNRVQQSELVFRFYGAKLRRKIHWDINSSEFRSPVAYIRMREKKGTVDVVITHRDSVSPEFFENSGKFLLSYTIPDRYFGTQQKSARVVKDRAQALSGTPLFKEKAPAKKSRIPVTGFQRIKFKDEPVMRPIAEFISKRGEMRVDRVGLPESFNRAQAKPMKKNTGAIWERQSWVAVAQDDLEENFANEEEEGNNATNNVSNNAANNASNNIGNNAANNAANNASNNLGNNAAANNVGNNAANNISNNAANNASNNLGNNAAPANNAASGNFGNGSFNSANQNAFSELNEKKEDAGLNNVESNTGNFTAPPEENLTSNPAAAPTPAVDVEATESTPPSKYTGKPIFMEFYDSPLALVLKSFNEETGNNFVFPAEVGNIPITVSFKGVPWDEALKGILETHSLGMVKIGKNVVRVDVIANLNNYMAALEQAKQFESRRAPTRVMVFRLNNGVAADVKGRLEDLARRDRDYDPRVQFTADERTNAIVMEAPEYVLQKFKAIMDRMDTQTAQVEIASRIVEVSKTSGDFFGISWGNNFNFDPGRALGFGTLNFPNSMGSNFAVDPGVNANATAPGVARFRFGSLNKFIDLDLLLKMEERKGTSNVLQSNRVLVLDGQKALVQAGTSQFFRPAAGGNIINPAAGAGGAGGGEAAGLSQVNFLLSLEVTPQVTDLGSVLMNLDIQSDTPGDVTGEVLANKNTRQLQTQMVRASGETGVIGGIYDTKKTTAVQGIPFLSSIPILGALFRSTTSSEQQTEMLIMVTPTIVGGSADRETIERSSGSENLSEAEILSKTIISRGGNTSEKKDDRL